MALRDFLYPYLEVRLILARALDVDMVQVGKGTLSKEYQEIAAQALISNKDAQRLNIKTGDFVELESRTGKVVVAAQVKDNQPEGLIVMQPSPWAFAVIESISSSQGTKVTIKPSKGSVTLIHDLV